VYLERFTFPGDDKEIEFMWRVQRTCYDSFYPFQVFAARQNEPLQFECAPMTILYGGNGSGKTTALNVIAEKTGVKRDSSYNKSAFFPDYVDMCAMELAEPLPENSRIITSDDVFDYMLNVRSLNEGIDLKRETLFGDYLDAKYADFRMQSIADLERLKTINASRRKTQSKFVRDALIDNIPEFSNGENAYRYFIEKIEENGLYILDEPENSLSPKRQQELARFLEDSCRFFGCQFIISTHSPFLISMRGAKIYDLDARPMAAKPWTALENMRVYFDFFQSRQDEF